MGFKAEQQFTQIYNVFIDEYMPSAISTYVVAYLYAYRHIVGGNANISNSDIAKALDILESDVKKAWKYWSEQGILEIHDDDTVEFLPIISRKDIEKETEKGKEKSKKIIAYNRPPVYSPEELSVYLEKSQVVKGLFLSAQEHLGKLLSQNDMGVIFSFYDWLGLPVEVIEILLAYCVGAGHGNIRYIEKVAITWAEEGINSVETAMTYINMRKTGYKQVMSAFGQSNRMPVPTEENYIKQWLSEYNLTLEMVKMACEKTVMQTGNVSFPYADKILKKWRDANVKTKDDILKLEAEFTNEKTQKKMKDGAGSMTVSKTQRVVKQNRFVNYEQRDWDFKEIERLQKEWRKKEIEDK